MNKPAIDTVLLTRPQRSNSALAEQLARRGVRCIDMPMLEVVDVSSVNDIDLARQQIERLSSESFDYALFVSANAVHAALRFTQLHTLSWPISIACLGMGASTEAAITANGWQLTSCLDAASNGSLTSEQMLDQPWAQEVAGRRVAIIKGWGGRETMAEVLSSRGAGVESIALYRRQPTLYSDDELQNSLDHLAQQPHSSAIVAASGETLQYIDDALQRSRLSVLKGSVHCIVPSPRLVEQARERGFVSIIESQGAGDAAFIESILNYSLASAK